MDGKTLLQFQLIVMDIVDSADCVTANDYSFVSQELHEALESAVMDMCEDAGIEYDPVY